MSTGATLPTTAVPAGDRPSQITKEASPQKVYIEGSRDVGWGDLKRWTGQHSPYFFPRLIMVSYIFPVVNTSRRNPCPSPWSGTPHWGGPVPDPDPPAGRLPIRKEVWGFYFEPLIFQSKFKLTFFVAHFFQIAPLMQPEG